MSFSAFSADHPLMLAGDVAWPFALLLAAAFWLLLVRRRPDGSGDAGAS
ncbi:MAG: hypothetical protein AAF763_14005 [Pseudomonadota bacterium]